MVDYLGGGFHQGPLGRDGTKPKLIWYENNWIYTMYDDRILKSIGFYLEIAFSRFIKYGNSIRLSMRWYNLIKCLVGLEDLNGRRQILLDR